MAKLNYNTNHSRSLSKLNDEYWTNPKTGFDRAWHTGILKKDYNSGIKDLGNTDSGTYRKQTVSPHTRSAVEEARKKLGYK